MASNPNPYKTTVFHHTSEEAVDAIYKSGHIKQSDTENGDAVFGQGVYANKMGPECSRTNIAKNNYDGNTSFVQDQIGQGKVNAAIEIQYNRDEVIKVDADGRDVYKIENDISVSKIVKVHYRDKDDA